MPQPLSYLSSPLPVGSKWSSVWMCVVGQGHVKDMSRTNASIPRKRQSLPRVRLGMMAKPPSVLSVNIDNVDRKCPTQPSLLPASHVYGLKTAPLQRPHLPRLAKPASLFTYIYNNPVSLVFCIQLYLPVNLYIINMLSIQGCYDFSIWEPIPLDPPALCVRICMSIISFFLHCSQSGFWDPSCADDMAPSRMIQCGISTYLISINV